MADAGYFVDAYDDVPARPRPVRVLRVLLWVNAAITGVMVVAGVLAAGVSVDVVAHLVVLAAPGAVAGAIAWRITRGSSRTGQGPLVWLLVAMGWQVVRAVSVLLGGDPRGFTSMLLPLAIIVLAASRPVRAYLRGPHPRPYGGRGDAGAGMVQYAGLVVLAALILGSLVALGLPGQVQSGTGSALCRIFSSGDCSPTADRGPAKADPNAGNPNGGNPNGGAPPGTKTAPAGCGLSLSCLWKGVTTDPYDVAQQIPCTDALSCFTHGLSVVQSAEWNVQKAFIDDVKSIGDLIKDPTSLADGIGYVWNHPADAARQLIWDDESTKLWEKGNYLGAIGRTAWNVGSWAIPGVNIGKAFSKAGKFAKLAKLADKTGKLGRLARSAKAAGKAADNARRLASKGDLKGAEKAANDAAKKADGAVRQARKDGCAVALPLRAVPVLPHFGRYGAAALPACAMHESEQARKAREAAKKAQQAINDAWSRKANFPTKQLQHEYKHANDFGIKGNWNKVNGAAFREAVQRFMRGPGIRRIRGTYRGNPALFFYDDATKRVVYLHPNGDFWGAYGNLTPKQVFYLNRDAKFGGG